ncbi:probable CCR4-associated factor 1 homolog 6 [Prosopis cineraria]|uniref:probable CCR4-associated factor 1 homolog 6 n=1 Tax=Prosopis cineraria TaxID=364024 RepID=UPI0024104EC7|nr:probable CCR4-associated factor 1 homolog 6 [Prosopis cineraria]
MSTSLERSDDSVQIVDVWKENIKQEFDFIIDAIKIYPYVSLDTKFSGSLFTVRNYGALTGNLGLAKLIQVGLTLSNENGQCPMINGQRVCWQFKFCEFIPKRDPKSRDMIDALRDSGMDLEKNQKDGVTYSDFAELLMSSGLVMRDEVSWITFQGSSHFGYLVKLLTAAGKKNLPETEQEFMEILNFCFPVFYDVKHLIRSSTNVNLHQHGGGELEDVARFLEVEERVGPAAAGDQAGSDSLLTSIVFNKLKHDPQYFNGAIPETCRGFLPGLAGLRGVGGSKNRDSGGKVGRGRLHSCWLMGAGLSRGLWGPRDTARAPCIAPDSQPVTEWYQSGTYFTVVCLWSPTLGLVDLGTAPVGLRGAGGSKSGDSGGKVGHGRLYSCWLVGASGSEECRTQVAIQW